MCSIIGNYLRNTPFPNNGAIGNPWLERERIRELGVDKLMRALAQTKEWCRAEEYPGCLVPPKVTNAVSNKRHHKKDVYYSYDLNCWVAELRSPDPKNIWRRLEFYTNEDAAVKAVESKEK